MMKISAKTIEILKNFSNVRSFVAISRGNVIKSVRDDYSITCRGTTDQVFETPFAIAELPRFLNVLSIMKNDVEIDFHKSYMDILSGKQRVSYYYCAPDHVRTETPKDDFFDKVKDVSAITTFDISKAVMAQTLKAGNVLQSPEISIIGDGSKIHLRAIKADNPLSDVYSVEIAESKAKFVATFNSVTMAALPPIDYNVKIMSGTSLFAGDGYEYVVAMNKRYTNLANT